MIRRLAPPIGLIVAVLLFWLGVEVGILPTADNVIVELSNILLEAGGFAIAGIAAAENVVFLNIYFPGSVVVLGVMASTYGDPAAAFKVFLFILVGQLCGLTLSERIGLVSSRRGIQEKRSRAAGLLPLLLFWHPHTASATAFALGVNRSRYRYLVIVGGCFAWSCFWGLVMYFGLGTVVNEIGWDYVTLIYAVCWFCVEIYRSRRPNI